MLEMGFSAEDMKRIAEAERYYSWFEITKCEDEDEKRKWIESNKMLRFSGLYEIYEKLIEKNPCYIALIINDLAEDELKMFCEDERIKSRFSGKASPRKGEYYWMLEDYEEELIKAFKPIQKYKINRAGKSELVGIHESNDLNNLLPSEIALLSNSETENIFYWALWS